MRQLFHHQIAAWALTAALSLTAQAADGVIEINQASVEAAGGFPFEITRAGSYKLTGNLEVDDIDTIAIWVRAPYVTLDLNGFSIRGPVTCELSGLCDQAGLGAGVWAAFAPPQMGPDGVLQCTIDAVPGGPPGVEIRNGVISGMGGDGIGGLFEGRVEAVRVVANGGHGIEASEGSTVTGCLASRNALEGIAGGASLIERNTVFGNGRVDLLVLGGAAIGNVVFAGGDDALSVSRGAGYGMNTIQGNLNANNAGELGCNVINGETFCPQAVSQ